MGGRGRQGWRNKAGGKWKCLRVAVPVATLRPSPFFLLSAFFLSFPLFCLSFTPILLFISIVLSSHFFSRFYLTFSPPPFFIFFLPLLPLIFLVCFISFSSPFSSLYSLVFFPFLLFPFASFSSLFFIFFLSNSLLTFPSVLFSLSPFLPISFASYVFFYYSFHLFLSPLAWPLIFTSPSLRFLPFCTFPLRLFSSFLLLRLYPLRLLFLPL